MTAADDLALALELADLADAVTVPYARRAADLRPEQKADRSPVTEADREAERVIRDRVAAARPTDGFVGEEGGEVAGTGTRRWVVDPIDGTREFLAGAEDWETLIALVEDDRPLVAVISAPLRGVRLTAVRGGGAHRDGRRLAVSDARDLASARWSTYLSVPGRADDPRVHAFRAAAGPPQRPHSYARVAAGELDVAFDVACDVWDLAAPKLVIEEAGGRLTALDGGSWVGARTALASNGSLHDAAVAALRV